MAKVYLVIDYTGEEYGDSWECIVLASLDREIAEAAKENMERAMAERYAFDDIRGTFWRELYEAMPEKDPDEADRLADEHMVRIDPELVALYGDEEGERLYEFHSYHIKEVELV